MSNIPSWIAWIKWSSFLTYAFSLLMKVGGRLAGWLGAAGLPSG